MNVGYQHTPYNYKFFNCSWTVLQYQKVHFFFKSTALQNFLATGLKITDSSPRFQIPIKIPSYLCWIPVRVGPLGLLHHNNGPMVTEFKHHADK